MSLVAAIHDVTPVFRDEVAWLWRACRAMDLTPALFVVPRWHGYARLGGDAAFVAWLRERVDDGAEVFLHGHRHDERESRRSPLDHLRAAGRTDAEAEFLGLDRRAARRRLVAGRDLLRASGLPPVGFVPPAWLAPSWLGPLAGALGMPMTEDAHGIAGHGGAPVRVAAPAVRWSGRSAWRAHASVGVARVRRAWHDAAPTVRLALHPRDLHHPATAASVATELRWWGARRDGRSYRAVLAGVPAPWRVG